MKESKKILRSLQKIKDEAPVKRKSVTIRAEYRDKLMEKYGSIENFEQAVIDLYDELKKQQEG